MREIEEVKFITHDELPQLRNDMIEEQNNICPICSREIDQPVVDHQHIAKVKGDGCIRAVVCSMCNTFIARSENNCKRHKISYEMLPTVLRNMADYFENAKTNIVHPSENKKYKPVKKFNKTQYNKVEKYWTIMYPRRKTKCPQFPKNPKLTNEWQEHILKSNQIDDKIKSGELRKINKREIALVEKWYPIMYPKRTKMPQSPTNGYINDEYKKILEDILVYRNKNNC